MDNGRPPKAAERLDVEDEDDRQARIQAYLEKLNASSRSREFSEPAGLPKFDFGDRRTFPIEPPTELLSRVQAFLPQLEASNALLSQRAHENPDSINIEHITEDMEQYIEMNLGLGVFEDRSKLQHASGNDDDDSEMSTSSDSSDSDTNGRAQDEDEDSDADSDESSEIITSFVPSRPIKPLPRRSSNKPRPEIVVLNETSES